MNRLQSRLFTLLSEVDAICKKHDVEYYLAAGCSLGAIRHGGFLPWDDDVDIYITRDNWEKLKKVIYDELPNNRNFVCEENTPLYCNPIGRYVDKESTFMIKAQVLCGECCGLVIEFFIMDPMPADKKKQLQHRRYMKVFTELLSPYFVATRNIYTANTDFDFGLYKRYYFLSRIFGKERILKYLKKKFTKTPEEGCDSFCMRWGIRTLMYPAYSFGTPKEVEFEGRTFPVVEYPEVTFRIAYGDDWMYVPNHEEKITHDLINSLDESYEIYKDIYMPLLDKQNLITSYENRKKNLMRGLIDKNLINIKFAQFRAEVLARQIMEETDISILTGYLNSGNYEELNNNLAEYFNIQFSDLMKQDGVFVPVSDEYLNIVILSLILQGKYYTGLKLLKYRETYDNHISEELKETKEKAIFCRNLSIAIYDDKNPENVKMLLDEKKRNYSELIDFKRAELWLMKVEALDKGEYNKLIDCAESALTYFSNDGEIMSYRAFGLYCADRKDEAREEYERAINNTRNGFVWKEAKEYFGLIPDGEIYEEEI